MAYNLGGSPFKASLWMHHIVETLEIPNIAMLLCPCDECQQQSGKDDMGPHLECLMLQRLTMLSLSRLCLFLGQ